MYDPFEQMTFTYDRCFLCGKLLNEANNSREHVIPKWLQKKFDLWNRQLVLLNGTSIRYKDLTIPCCKDCNNAMSKSIEKPIREGVRKGYLEFVKIDPCVIFQWLNKISYGFLFKELSLRAQIKNTDSEPIWKAEYLKERKMQYLFLRSIISNTSYVNNPWSILLFRINPAEAEPYWSYENPFVRIFCIRMNDIGIIAHLMDNGYNQGYFMQFEDMRELLDKTLHPIQFAEISARLYYKASLFYREPWYTTVFNENQNPGIIISHGISGEAFDDWNQEKYAQILTYFWEIWGLKFEDVYRGNDFVLSYLRNDDGTFNDFFDQA